MGWKTSLVVVTAAGCLLSPLAGGRIRAAGSNAAQSAAAAAEEHAAGHRRHGARDGAGHRAGAAGRLRPGDRAAARHGRQPRHARLVRRAWPGGQHTQIRIDLHAVGIDDNAAEFFRDRERKRGFSARGRSGDDQYGLFRLAFHGCRRYRLRDDEQCSYVD